MLQTVTNKPFFALAKKEQEQNLLVFKAINGNGIPAIFRGFSFQKIYSRFSEGKNTLSFLIPLPVSDKIK